MKSVHTSTPLDKATRGHRICKKRKNVILNKGFGLDFPKIISEDEQRTDLADDAVCHATFIGKTMA